MNRLTVILCAGATLALCGSCAGYRSGLRRHDPKTAELAGRVAKNTMPTYSTTARIMFRKVCFES